MRASARRSAVCLLAAGVIALCAVSLASAAVAPRVRSSMLHQHAAGAPAAPELPADAFLFPRLDELFPTSSLDHLEPVLNYRVRHEDNAHLHTLENLHPASTHPLKVGNAANSIGAHSIKRRERLGHAQPFPNTIAVSFRAFDQDWSFPEMHLETRSWAENTRATVTDAHGRETSVQHNLNTYRSVFSATPVAGSGESAAQGWAIITLSTDGLMTAIIHTDEDTFQIDPLFVHEHQMDTTSDKYERLNKAAVHGMVIFRHADAKHLGINEATGKPFHTCGVAKPRGPVRQAGNFSAVEQLTEDDIVEREEELMLDATGEPLQQDGNDIRLERVATARRLLAYPPGYGLTLWTNCYPQDQSAHKLSLGVAVDYGYYAIYGSTANVLNSIATVYAAVNAIYQGQFNVFLDVAATDIRTAADSTTWNLSPATLGGRCSVTINDHLNYFTSWRASSKPKVNALWHLFTACFPSPGTVGLAWLGVVCSSQYGTGVSSWTSTFWLIVAHEMGHNLNAAHTFQNGQGSTGGIMDYGDGTYPVGSGVYQFNSQYNQPEICGEIASIVSTTGFTPYCFANYAPVCGNGVIERGEQCDDTTTCCSNCQLTGQCTRGAGNTNACCTASCTYAPTTTSCDNGLGYCGNGACVSAVCSKYGLSYCGLEASGCKQRCGGGSANYACSSSWSTPDCKLANGLVCATSPYSACSTGSCVATTAPTTYSWVAGTQSACSCSGTYTVSYTCKSSAGATVADSSCTTAKPATSGTCTAPSSCYTWTTGAFTTCSNDCGAGIQTRSVTCTSTASGATVSNAQCTTTKPVTQQSCNLGTCPTSWLTSAYGSCTVSCNGGVQTRTNQCRQLQNGAYSNVAASFCTNPPVTSQPCNTPPCAAQWSYSAWGVCSATCGTGTQTRTATCVDSVSGAVRPTADCAGTAVTTQNCNTPVCADYRWYAKPYGACSVTCGGGTQTRNVACYNYAVDPTYTSPINSNMCTLTAPVSITNCNTAACPVLENWVWLSGSWSTCSLTCGIGISTRTVTCVDSAHGNVAGTDTNCDNAGTKPVTQQSCGAACPVYVWVQSGFGACSVACGSGTQTQTVTCRDQSTNALATGKCSGTAPASSRACNTAACATYAWVQGAPSACSVACNGGTQTYTPKCYDVSVSPNVLVASTLCTSVKPATSASCNTQSCPTFWSTGPFSACSSPCGPSGIQTRSVKCFFTTDNIATATAQPDSACTTSKPATVASCNSNACPSWQPSSDWGACSATCGLGVSTRTIACQSFDGTPAPDSSCSGVSPVTTQACQVIPCAHWHRTLYGDCSKQCADSSGPGMMNRTVICRMPHDDPLYYGIATDDANCPQAGGDTGDGEGTPGVANGIPPKTAVCATDACPSYYWRQDQSSACSASCGTGGTRTATVNCINSISGAVSSSSLCLGEPLPSTYPCNVFPCPNYVWATGNWTACSSFCGTGNQTRTVQCRNLNPDPSVHYAVIDVELDVCVGALGAKPADAQSCTMPEGICVGNSTTADRKNGRCNAAGSACVCRSGFSGPLCDQAQSLSNVETNGAEFSAGIPLGEPLQVTWSSDSTIIRRVSVVLQKPEWPVGQYLAQGIQNTGLFTWNTGSVLAAGLEPGSGYTILVFASKSARGVSAPFAVADPCAYMSCGAHGTCSRGLCTCSSGYSGSTCGVGPCESSFCDPVYSSCSNTAVIQSGQYLSENVCALNASTTACLGGFTGAQCKTPPECATLPACQYGGDLGSVQQSGSNCTGTCVCRGNYVGLQCQTCGLQCLHGSVADASCKFCTGCSAGYFGSLCECKYFLLQLRLNTDISAWFSGSFDASNLSQQRWAKTLSLDMLGAVSLVTTTRAAVSVQGIEQLATTSSTGSPQVMVSVRLSLACASTAEMGADGSDGGWSYSNYSPVQGPSAEQMALITHEALAVFFTGVAQSGLDAQQAAVSSLRRQLLQVPDPSSDPSTLLATYNAFAPLISDMDSPVWHGQVSGTMDATFTVQASDPSAEYALSSPAAPADCFQTDCNAAPASGGDGGGSTSDTVLDKIKDSVLYQILLLVGCVLVLGLIVLATCCIYRRNKSGGSSSGSGKKVHNLGRPAAGSMNEMTSNPALAGIAAKRWDQI